MSTFRTESTDAAKSLEQRAAEFLDSPAGQRAQSDRRKGVLPASVTGPTVASVFADIDAAQARAVRGDEDDDEEEDDPSEAKPVMSAAQEMTARNARAWKKTPSRKDRARGAKAK